MKNNKGAVSVLLSAVILAMILVIGAAGDACSLAVAKAYAQRTNYMACKSVLAEYNEELFTDYGLMAFNGGKYEIKDRVTEYTSMMSRVNDKSKDEMVFFDIELEDLSVDCTGRSLSEKSLFMEQIREIMKLKAVENGAEVLMEAVAGKADINGKVSQAKENFARAEEAAASEETGDTAENKGISLGEKTYDPEEDTYDRVLKSQRVIDSLPSAAEGSDAVNHIEKIDMGNEEELMKLGEDCSGFLNKFYGSISAGADKFHLVDYADEYFMNAAKDPSGYKETFFMNEMEYMLKGYMSDSRNLSAVKKDLFLLRTALNLVHIYSDPQKCQIILEMAAASGTGPYAAALQFVLAAAWAGAEAGEDVERLLAGGNVPFIKERSDWKTDIESIFSGSVMISSEYEGGRGLDYTQYLKLFLLTCSKEVVMERIMDLIQINIKGRYDMGFDLRNHITGFTVSADYDRKAYLVEVLPGIIEDDLMHIEEEFSY